MAKEEGHIEPIRELTPELVHQYQNGLLSNRMRHEVERFLLNHPFEAEAMEGFSESHLIEEDLNQLSNKLESRLEKPAKTEINWRQYLGFAATFLLLLCASIFLVYFYEGTDQKAEISLDQGDAYEIGDQAPMLKQPLPIKGKVLPKADKTTDDKREQMASTQASLKEEPKFTEDLSMVASEEIQAKEYFLADTAILAEAEFESIERSEEGSFNASKKIQEKDGVKVQKPILDPEAKEEIRKESLPAMMITPELKASKEEVAADFFILTGQITDADTGEPIPGVKISIQGYLTGVKSDLDGKYSINVKEGDYLVIDFEGMKPEEFTVYKGQTNVDIALETEFRQLNEIVVTAHGTTFLGPRIRYLSPRPDINSSEYKDYLEKELRYPEEAINEKVEGKVRLKLTISETGKILDIEVIKSLSPACDAEAIRLVKEGPAWKAAIKDDQPIESTTTVKIDFELEE